MNPTGLVDAYGNPISIDTNVAPTTTFAPGAVNDPALTTSSGMGTLTSGPTPTTVVSGGGTTPSSSPVSTSRYDELAAIAAKGDLNPSQRTEWEALQRSMQSSQPGIDEQAINDVYNPTMDYLNQAEGAVRQDFPNVLNSAQQAYETAIAELTNSKEQNSATLISNTQQVQNRKEDALTSARRLYDELRRGYQQRFGGSTSAGQASSELASVEQQRQMGGTNRDYGQAMNTIQTQKLQLDKDYQLGSQKILQSKTEAIAQANRDFQNKLLEIQSQRAQTESAKAAAKLDALNTLRNQAYAAQQQALTYQQNLDMFYKQQQADVQTYAQKLALSSQYGTNAATSYTPPLNPTSSLQVNSTNAQTPSSLTGQISTNPTKTDPLTGAIQTRQSVIDPVTGQVTYVYK